MDLNKQLNIINTVFSLSLIIFLALIPQLKTLSIFLKIILTVDGFILAAFTAILIVKLLDKRVL